VAFLSNKIYMKDSSFRHGVLSSNSIFCAGGCGVEESVDHIFLGFAFFVSLWSLVLQ